VIAPVNADDDGPARRWAGSFDHALDASRLDDPRAVDLLVNERIADGCLQKLEPPSPPGGRDDRIRMVSPVVMAAHEIMDARKFANLRHT
jgi:hypothetical protein